MAVAVRVADCEFVVRYPGSLVDWTWKAESWTTSSCEGDGGVAAVAIRLVTINPASQEVCVNRVMDVWGFGW
jgi:hypothetical protein